MLLFAPASTQLVDGDPAELIPELLDRLAELGDLAKQVNRALGSNGHKAEALAELKGYLEQQAKK